MGKWTDKLYITQREWATDFGGAAAASKSRTNRGIFGRSILPFGCCSQTFVQLIGKGAAKGVCPIIDTETGLLFDRHSISDEDHGKYVDLQWEEDPETREVICPISRKALNENIPSVVIKASGWLYAADTVSKLNIEKRNFVDLMTGIKFTRSDVISVALPRTMQQSSKTEKVAVKEQKNAEENKNNFAVKRVLDSIANKPSSLVSECHRLGLERLQLRFTAANQIIKYPSAIPMPASFQPPVSSRGTSGAVAASLTSTSMSIATKNDLLAPPSKRRR